MDAYDAAFSAFSGAFLLLALISYSWEIWEQTPLDTVYEYLLSLISRRKKEHEEHSPTQSANGECDARRNHTAHSRRNFNWRRWLTWLPGMFWLLSFIPVFLLYKKPVAKGKVLLDRPLSGWSDDTLDIDPDIGGKCTARLLSTPLCCNEVTIEAGLGIRLGVYVPIGLATFTLLVGLLHNQDSGAKEIGNAQLLSKHKSRGRSRLRF